MYNTRHIRSQDCTVGSCGSRVVGQATQPMENRPGPQARNLHHQRTTHALPRKVQLQPLHPNIKQSILLMRMGTANIHLKYVGTAGLGMSLFTRSLYECGSTKPGVQSQGARRDCQSIYKVGGETSELCILNTRLLMHKANTSISVRICCFACYCRCLPPVLGLYPEYESNSCPGIWAERSSLICISLKYKLATAKPSLP